MANWPLFLGCTLLLACSSGGLPRVHPAISSGPLSRCASPFPQGKWQLAHSIEADLPGGRKGFLIGVSVVLPVENSVHCVIMSIEGLILFDALDDGRLTVNRAIAPFDADGFAAGLMGDVRLVFFSPPGALIESGVLQDGATICRHDTPEGGAVDVIIQAEGGWEIRRYDPNLQLIRRVSGRYSAGPPGDEGLLIADTIELTAYGQPGYKLSLKLLEAVALTP